MICVRYFAPENYGTDECNLVLINSLNRHSCRLTSPLQWQHQPGRLCPPGWRFDNTCRQPALYARTARNLFRLQGNDVASLGGAERSTPASQAAERSY
jgi:hypothetical protein